MIADQYGVHVERKHLDGVTIEGDKVHLEQYCPREWKAHCNVMPAIVKFYSLPSPGIMYTQSCMHILRDAISALFKDECNLCNLLSCLPSIEIAITNVPESHDAEPLEITVEGLNVGSAVFKFLPEVFMKLEADTTRIKVYISAYRYCLSLQTILHFRLQWRRGVWRISTKCGLWKCKVNNNHGVPEMLVRIWKCIIIRLVYS
jgi:hypothetical protein